MFERIAEKLKLSKKVHIEKIRIEQGDILGEGQSDSILFFMYENLKWGEGLNGRIRAMAGADSVDQWVHNNVITPNNGEVYILPPFNSPYKAMFMAILAEWDGGNGYEERDLMNCYRGAIQKAQELGIKNIIIPAMGRDKRDFPHIRFARVAVKAILEVLDERMDFVTISCIDHTMMRVYQEQVAKAAQKGKI